MAGVCGFAAADRVAVAFPDRLTVLRTDGSVQAEIPLEDGTPTLCAISAGRIAILMQKSKNTGNYAVKVFDKNGKSVYNRGVAPDAEPTAIAFGGNVLYIRAGSYLYRFSGDGRAVLAILPDSDSSLLVCGSAFASRYYTHDFSDS